jgi:hypothetical protein
MFWFMYCSELFQVTHRNKAYKAVLRIVAFSVFLQCTQLRGCKQEARVGA